MNASLTFAIDLKGISARLSFEVSELRDGTGLGIRRCLVTRDASGQATLELYFVVKNLDDFEQMVRAEPWHEDLFMFFSQMRELVKTKILSLS